MISELQIFPWHILREYSYPLVVTITFFGIYIFFNRKIIDLRNLRLSNIKKRKIRDAVETDSHVDNQGKNLKEKGIHGIEDRFSFLSRAFPIVLSMLWLVVVSIPYIGSAPNSYITLITAIVSVIAGTSLRPFLENLFSGVVISFFKSIKIGDTVIIDDHYGLIEEIGLTYSVLKRWDWYRIVIPNSRLLQKEIQNLTMNDAKIWAHIEFFLDPSADIEKVEAIAHGLLKKSHKFSTIEETSFWVMDMQKDSIKCWLAAWADNPGQAWELRNEMCTLLTKELQKSGICFHQFYINNETRSYPHLNSSTPSSPTNVVAFSDPNLHK